MTRASIPPGEICPYCSSPFEWYDDQNRYPAAPGIYGRCSACDGLLRIEADGIRRVDIKPGQMVPTIPQCRLPDDKTPR